MSDSALALEFQAVVRCPTSGSVLGTEPGSSSRAVRDLQPQNDVAVNRVQILLGRMNTSPILGCLCSELQNHIPGFRFLPYKH